MTRENSSVFDLHLKILIDSENLIISDKSFQTDGEAKLNVGYVAFNLCTGYNGFDNKLSELKRKQRTGV